MRIPALLISQFDDVITWISDHDRGFSIALTAFTFKLDIAVRLLNSRNC